MSDLTHIEKLKLERLFEMGSGYVLDFSNRTFSEFMFDTLGIDIYDDRYLRATGSKANRLRAFWHKEPNHVVGYLLADLLEYWKAKKLTYGEEISEAEQQLYDECMRIVERLRQGSPLEHIEEILPISDSRELALLKKSIIGSIRDNEPETTVDRLHTYAMKHVRHLCDKHGIDYSRKTPLHSLFGQYVNHLRRSDLIESPITAKILKGFVNLFETLNDARNKHSFAHDNPILDYNESMLIHRHVSSAIAFTQSFEGEDVEHSDQDQQDQDPGSWDEIPF